MNTYYYMAYAVDGARNPQEGSVEAPDPRIAESRVKWLFRETGDVLVTLYTRHDTADTQNRAGSYRDFDFRGVMVMDKGVLVSSIEPR